MHSGDWTQPRYPCAFTGFLREDLASIGLTPPNISLPRCMADLADVRSGAGKDGSLVIHARSPTQLRLYTSPPRPLNPLSRCQSEKTLEAGS